MGDKKMKMKKGKFTLIMVDHSKKIYKQVVGLKTCLFGVHKGAGEQGCYVTHVGTGYCLADFCFLKQAKRFVERLHFETWPVSWDSSNDAGKYGANSDLIRDITYQTKDGK